MTNEQAAMIAAASFLRRANSPISDIETDAARAHRVCALASELLRTLNTGALGGDDYRV